MSQRPSRFGLHGSFAATRAIALLAGALAAGCGGGPAPCDSVYAGRCGATCTRDGNCAGGQYCASGVCTADCATGARGCGGGQTCSAQGRCVAPGDDGGGRDVAPVAIPDGAGGPGCADITVQLARRQAALMLLIDQSGSMTERFGGGTRWDAIRSTLVDPNNGVVRPLEGEVRFGLAMYTSRNGSSSGTCPLLAPPILTSLNNYAAIRDAMNAAEPIDDTPTAESVTAAVGLLTSDPDNVAANPAIVLATDGEPDTCADPDAQNNSTRQDAARAASVAAVRAAFAQGIHTYVVSVGSDTSMAHLQDLADAGAGTSGTRFFRADDPAALTAAFRTITSGVRTCTFRLNGQIDPTLAGQGNVRLDGMPLEYNGANGWRLSAPNEIELTGTACESARTTAATLTAIFPCDAVTPG